MTYKTDERNTTTEAIVKAQPQAIAAPMNVDGILEHVHVIQDIVDKVMKKDVHYGVIPGCKLPTLLQAGAEVLCLAFRLRPDYEVVSKDLGNGHREYETICTLYAASGDPISQGVGNCSTMETKYRFRNAVRVCPECGIEGAVRKGKKEYGGGWICFAKIGGCGAKWPDGAREIESQQPGRKEHDNPADYYNTCKKMSKKRAYTDAAKTATATSAKFTTDMEDMEPDKPPPTKKGTNKRPVESHAQDLNGYPVPEMNTEATANQMAEMMNVGTDEPPIDAPPEEKDIFQEVADAAIAKKHKGVNGDLYRIETYAGGTYENQNDLMDNDGFDWEYRTNDSTKKALIKHDVPENEVQRIVEDLRKLLNDSGYPPFIEVYNQRTGEQLDKAF